ncbi:uncharacterized protein LOC105194914 [Solenopsis invicta]|uniref:uncharacterized protein LOC105194914 n=1 Tax=Solenopsis invicta TaxID=13686 RepID=UPI000E33F405|nr:uncharacterized protein LOC105194914 [Solenopsis invicta]
MKCFIAILFLALVAIVMAAEKTSETEKTKETVVDASRDKRGLAYYSPYAYSPYAYSAYHLPYAYSTYAAYPYYNRYNYPSYYYNPYHY